VEEPQPAVGIFATLRGGTGFVMATVARLESPCLHLGSGIQGNGPETSQIIHYCSAECRIHHEFNLWMHNFNVAVEYTMSKMNIVM
jgi:hypothetical protein